MRDKYNKILKLTVDKPTAKSAMNVSSVSPLQEESSLQIRSYSNQANIRALMQKQNNMHTSCG
jgi:hypothetical protein